MEEVEEALRQCSELRRDLESSNDWNRLLRVAEGFEARLQVASDVFDWVRVDIARISEGSNYDIQLDLSHFQVSADQRYLLSFLARADAPRAVGVGVAQGHAPWLNLGYYERLDLNESWQFFQRSFVATADEENGRIQFDLGESIASVELSHIKLRNDTEGDLAQPASPQPTPPDCSARLRQKC